MKQLSILLAALLAALPMAAQTTQKLSATKANDYALVYTLPNTAIDITIETETTVNTPGEFYQYAKKYLNIADPITKASTRVALKSITINTRGTANAEERYAVKFSAGNPPFMILNDQGLPLSVNTNKAFTPATNPLPVPVAAKPTPLQTEAARQAMSQEMLKSTSTAKRAELAAETIFSIRESRNDLITGQSDQSFPDGKALQLALDNLSAQEAALTAMFAGTSATSTEVSTVEFIPDSDDVTNKVIARISATKGVVPPTDLSGTPLYLSMQILEPGEAPTDDKGNPLPFPKGGFAYAIPGKAKITLNYDGRQVAQATLDIAQAGLVYGLNPNLFTDKKSPMYLILDPATGAIREIGSVTE